MPVRRPRFPIVAVRDDLPGNCQLPFQNGFLTKRPLPFVSVASAGAMPEHIAKLTMTLICAPDYAIHAEQLLLEPSWPAE